MLKLNQHYLKIILQRIARLKVSELLVLVAFGIIGTIFLVTSHAATPASSVQAETGTIHSPTTTILDTTASGGAAVKFGAATPAAYIPPDGKTYLGVSIDYANLDAFDAAAGIVTHPALYNGYTAANGDMQNQFTRVAQHPGITPMISWNVTMTNTAITNGSSDSYLAAQAAEVAAYGKPVFLRPDWEMNGSWSPTYDRSGGVSPAQYIASWRYIVAKFRKLAPNAAFVWCPNEGRPSYNGATLPADSWYPGDDSVDWVCVDSYPQYAAQPASVVTEADGLDDFANFANAHHKPLMLGEWARGNSSMPPDTSTVFDIVFGWANAYPNTVKALVYFDVQNQNDHVLETHPVGAAAFRSYTVNNPRYLFDIVQ